jgi:Ca-activated chloride channel homolog
MGGSGMMAGGIAGRSESAPAASASGPAAPAAAAPPSEPAAIKRAPGQAPVAATPKAARPLTAEEGDQAREHRLYRRAPSNMTLALAKDLAGRDVAVGTVRRLGKKTFYRKNDRWVDAEVKPEDEAKAIVVEQFSDAFFTLARAQTAETSPYLTFDETVTVKLGDQVYRIERAKN